MINAEPGGLIDRIAATTPLTYLWRFLVILALLLGFRIFALSVNATDLFFDEAQYWDWSRTLAFGYFSKPPLIAWLIRGATATCGMDEFCIRLPSPVFHTVTAFFIFLTGRKLYGAQTGFWSGVLYVILPGVSFSSGLISTDVPLLAAFAAALYFYVSLFEKANWPNALGLGVALGLGLLSKYAMAFFFAGIFVHALLVPDDRRRMPFRQLGVATAIGLAILSPNLIWNSFNGFATLGHTAANANWSGQLFHPIKMLEFIAVQFGVFGPVLFAGYLVILYRWMKDGLPAPDRLLLAFSLPILLAIAGQALLKHAEGNWAATAYVAASVLLAATLVRDGSGRTLGSSIVIHGVVLLSLAFGLAIAPKLTVLPLFSPQMRIIGWHKLADAVRDEIARADAAGAPYKALLTDERALTAELLYYLRDLTLPMTAWQEGPSATDHYEMTMRISKATPDPVLYITGKASENLIGGRFAVIVPVAEPFDTTVPGTKRPIAMFAVSGLRDFAP